MNSFKQPFRKKMGNNESIFFIRKAISLRFTCVSMNMPHNLHLAKDYVNRDELRCKFQQSIFTNKMIYPSKDKVVSRSFLKTMKKVWCLNVNSSTFLLPISLDLAYIVWKGAKYPKLTKILFSWFLARAASYIGYTLHMTVTRKSA